MLTLEKKVQQLIAGNRLIPPRQPVVVAVSGGADSMALLHILARLRPFFSCSLVAAWIDHGLRPEETDHEAMLVRNAANQLRVTFASSRVDVSTYRAAHGLSLEHAARELRYQALRQIACQHRAGGICVAHTANDQVEEVMIRLLRGSGRKGMSGMRMQHDDIIRPLLTTFRSEIMEYLQEKRIKYCHDSSNDDFRFVRNRIRHRLLPWLEEEFGKGIRLALLKSADNLAEDEALLEDLSGRAWQQVVTWNQNGECCRLDRKSFQTIHPALQRRICERLLWKFRVRASYVHILAIRDMALRGESGKQLHLPAGLRLLVRKDVLHFCFPHGRQADESHCPGHHPHLSR